MCTKKCVVEEWWCKKKAPPRSYRSWPQSRTHIKTDMGGRPWAHYTHWSCTSGKESLSRSKRWLAFVSLSLSLFFFLFLRQIILVSMPPFLFFFCLLNASVCVCPEWKILGYLSWCNLLDPSVLLGDKLRFILFTLERTSQKWNLYNKKRNKIISFNEKKNVEATEQEDRQSVRGSRTDEKGFFFPLSSFFFLFMMSGQTNHPLSIRAVDMTSPK